VVQILKDSVRDNITLAAEKLFAENGYKRTTMDKIAAEANVAVGNIYKYFSNKEALLNSIVTDEFLETFKGLTESRVDALNDPAKADAVRSMEAEEAGNLLDFFIKNRLKVIIVLARAEGSKHQTFRNDYIQSMIASSNLQMPTMRPKLTNSKIFQFTFKNRIEDTVRGIVSILETFEEEQEIRDAFATSWAYHQAGINSLINWCSR